MRIRFQPLICSSALVLAYCPLVFGQFYPLRDATWCSGNGFTAYNYHMPVEPDTAVQGRLYQKVERYSCELSVGPCSVTNDGYSYETTFLVRSAPDGKGYIRTLLDTTEFLVGDLGAQPGDTVRDVLIFNAPPPLYADWDEPLRPLYDVVVDSVVDVTRWDVTVSRHFVHEVTVWNPDDSAPYDFYPFEFFWQRGMGTSHGLVLRMRTSLSYNYLLGCAVSADSTTFSWYGVGDIPPWGYPPGGPPCCTPWDVGFPEDGGAMGSFVNPNPSDGRFTIVKPSAESIAVLNAHGSIVLHMPPYAGTIDLSTHPPGVYTAVLNARTGLFAKRLVVVR